jgi:hypothetical protein
VLLQGAAAGQQATAGQYTDTTTACRSGLSTLHVKHAVIHRQCQGKAATSCKACRGTPVKKSLWQHTMAHTAGMIHYVIDMHAVMGANTANPSCLPAVLHRSSQAPELAYPPVAPQ